MHKVINYGSFLQAYALKQLLLQNGADKVLFIDIKQGKQLKGFEPENSRKRLMRVVKEVLNGQLITKIRNRKHQDSVRRCIESNSHLLETDKGFGTQYDLAVIGSDEVFNCCQKSIWGYTPQLYGEIPEARQVISYAGSFGHTQYEQLVEHNIDGEIGATMRKLSAISVRDDNSFDIVKRLTGIEPFIHLDPVLAYGYQEEIAQAEPTEDKDYIVVYAYAGRIKEQSEINAICDFARKNNKKLYSFTYYDWCDKTISPSSPLEVLSWFRGADYVVTDTFHGTIFSIITQRQFVTLIRPSNQNKIGSLLKTMGLSHRGVYRPEIISETLTAVINYDLVDNRLNINRQQTHRYLDSVMNRCK